MAADPPAGIRLFVQYTWNPACGVAAPELASPVEAVTDALLTGVVPYLLSVA